MNTSLKQTYSIDKNLYQLDEFVADSTFRSYSKRHLVIHVFLFLCLLGCLGFSIVIFLYIIQINDNAKKLTTILQPLNNDSHMIHEIQSLLTFACHYINCSEYQLTIT